MSRREPVVLFIAGCTGHVGQALLQALETLPSRHGVQTAGLANSRLLQLGREKPRRRVGGDWEEVLGFLENKHSVFIDCTASEQVAKLYQPLLARGVGVVTANKLGLAGSQANYNRLKQSADQRHAPFFYETTVGAALPFINVLSNMKERGDQLRSLSAVLSGTLSWVLERVYRGQGLSSALRQAWEQGLTEPYPGDDLRGDDLVRKLVILLREFGIEVETAQVALEPLVPASCFQNDTVEEFFKSVAEYDKVWRSRANGRRLAVLCRWDASGPRIGLEPIGSQSGLPSVAPGDNLLCLNTRDYEDQPLQISGPGAGPRITAAGLLGDIVRASRTLQRQPSKASCTSQVSEDSSIDSAQFLYYASQ